MGGKQHIECAASSYSTTSLALFGQTGKTPWMQQDENTQQHMQKTIQLRPLQSFIGIKEMQEKYLHQRI